MRVRLAAYSTPQAGSPGYRWLWFDDALTESILASYLHRLQPHMPKDVCGLDKAVIAGGFAVDNRVVLYRIHDGGRDARGRPGRLFVIVAVSDRRAAVGHDLSSLLDHPAIATVCDEPPSQTSVNVNPRPSVANGAQAQALAKNKSIILTGDNAVSEAFGLIGALPVTADFNLQIAPQSVSLQVPNIRALRRAAGTPENGVTNPPCKGYRLQTVFLAMLIGLAIGLAIGHHFDRGKTPATGKDMEGPSKSLQESDLKQLERKSTSPLRPANSSDSEQAVEQGAKKSHEPP